MSTVTHTIAQAAHILHVSERTLRTYIRNGEINVIDLSVNRGGQQQTLRISDDELGKFLKRRSSKVTGGDAA